MLTYPNFSGSLGVVVSIVEGRDGTGLDFS
jgi:hypothetical protein